MERREPGVKVEMYNWAVCPYFVWGVGQSLWELRYVSFAPPLNHPEIKYHLREQTHVEAAQTEDLSLYLLEEIPLQTHAQRKTP